jgi:hypothetical protein
VFRGFLTYLEHQGLTKNKTEPRKHTKHETRNKKQETRNKKPETRNQKPETRN